MSEREHVDAAECWCKPYLYWITRNGNEVWVHRAEDGSEPPTALMLEVLEAAELGIDRELVGTA